MTRKLAPMAMLALVFALVPIRGAFAQTTTSVLEGTVADSSGAAMPGVSVQVKGGTVQRTVVTDAGGFYRAVALPAGTYTVTASLVGFKTKVLEGVTLVLNRTATLDITMEVAPRTETVTVTATVPLIDATNSSAKQVIDVSTIDSIPLNGRNYLDLIRLTPGVVVNTTARADLTNRDTNGSIMGERAGNTAFLIDGLENNDDFHGGAFQAFTQDAIQEFEVISAGYKAEFGRGSGGIVNVVTKTGSNAIHGNAFLFLRNDALDSSNVPGENPPELSRYDYGGTFGGPIRKERSWFFGSLEKVQETRGNIFPPNIPDALRAGEDFSRQPQTSDLRAFGKYTHRLNERNDFRASLSWTRAKLQNQLASPLSLPSESFNNLTHTWLGTVSLTTIFNPRLILDSSFGVRAQSFEQNLEATGLNYGIFFLDDGSSFGWGPPTGSVQTLDQRYYTAREVLGFFAGARHSVKVGFEFTRTVADGINGQGLMDVLVTIHPFFDLYGINSFQIPQGVAFLNPGDNLTKLRNNGISLFGQDDWRVVPSLTLSFGLRYDYDSKFNAKRNAAPRLGLAWSPDKKTVIQASWGMFYDRYRLGIAQSVPELGGFNGRTVVELNYPRLANDSLIPFPGSIGAFAAALDDPYFLNTEFGIPPGALVTAGNVQSLTGMTAAQFVAAVNQYLTGLDIMPFTLVDFSPSTGFLRQDITGGFQDQIRVARPFRTPYNRTFTVGFQRELRGGLAVGATYVHRRILDILGVRITNLAFESRNVGAPITTDGGPLLRTYGPWYDGKYDALILTLNKRFSHRFHIQSNYTYARSTDNLLNSNLGLGIAAQGGGAVPSDNLDLEFDRGNSDLFVPHSFVASGMVDLPVGFQFSGVLRATSGMYFSALGTFIDYDGDGIVSTRPSGTKRNQFRGAATTNLDLRVEKRFRFAERYAASVLIEFFNLTNARNPKLIDNSFVNGVPGPNFGQVKVPLPGREMQIGLRFQF